MTPDEFIEKFVEAGRDVYGTSFVRRDFVDAARIFLSRNPELVEGPTE
jgi:hypothetical protein